MISIIIPTFNRGPAIGATVESVLAQDMAASEVEIIIVDDGSTDDTWLYLTSIYGQHPQIRLFQTENSGVAQARNFGLNQANGEFIAYLDHDDFWKPHKLRLQWEVMQSCPDVGVVYCNWRSVDSRGTRLKSVTDQNWWHPAKGDVSKWVLMPSYRTHMYNPITTMSVPMMRTSLVRQVGAFDTEMVPSDDWDLWIKLSKITQFEYIPESLVDYVMHDEQQHKDITKATDSWLKIEERHRVNLRDHPLMRLWQWRFRRVIQDYKRYGEGRQALFAGNYKRLSLILAKQAIYSPIGLLHKRWLYLAFRAFKRQTASY